MVSHSYRPHSKFLFFIYFFFGKSFRHNPDHFCTCQNNHFFFLFFFCTAKVIQWSWYKNCALLLIPSHSPSFILTLHRTDGGVGNSSSLSYTPSSACAISSHSPICGISVKNSFIHIKLPAPNTLVCFGLLVTTLSFPFSLHMLLITTFSCSF